MNQQQQQITDFASNNSNFLYQNPNTTTNSAAAGVSRHIGTISDEPFIEASTIELLDNIINSNSFNTSANLLNCINSDSISNQNNYQLSSNNSNNNNNATHQQHQHQTSSLVDYLSNLLQ
jgi:hypothetical protein